MRSRSLSIIFIDICMLIFDNWWMFIFMFSICYQTQRNLSFKNCMKNWITPFSNWIFEEVEDKNIVTYLSSFIELERFCYWILIICLKFSCCVLNLNNNNVIKKTQDTIHLLYSSNCFVELKKSIGWGILVISHYHSLWRWWYDASKLSCMALEASIPLVLIFVA
jgi:hypothetical protein